MTRRNTQFVTALSMVLGVTLTCNQVWAQQSQAAPAASAAVLAPTIVPAPKIPAAAPATPAPAIGATPAPQIVPPPASPAPAGTNVAPVVPDPNCACKGKDAAAKAKVAEVLQKIANENATTTEYDAANCKLKCKEGFKPSPFKSFHGACVSPERYESQMNSIRLTANQKVLDELKLKVEGLPAAIKTELEPRIKGIENAMSAIQTATSDNTAAIGTLTADLATLATNLDDILERLEKGEHKDEQQDVRLANGEKRLTALEENVGQDPDPYFGIEGGFLGMVGTDASAEVNGEDAYLRFPWAVYANVSVSGGLCAPQKGHCFGGVLDGLTGNDNGYGWGIGGRFFAEFAAGTVFSIGGSVGGQYTSGGWEEGQGLHESPDFILAARFRFRIPVLQSALVPTLGFEIGAAIGNVMYLEDESDPSGRILARLTFGATRRHSVYKAPALDVVPADWTPPAPAAAPAAPAAPAAS
ncbi:hypothetical protein HYW18_01510 [Candidatus Uhrbacteria bacterium]|nr:hypothetical protein [Candidatus Uhrbacteria bacterium]